MEDTNLKTQSETDGTPKATKVIPIADGEAHLQNTIEEKKCYVCHKDFVEDMVLLRIEEKRMGFVCTHHEGVVQEFLRQFRIVPLGWVQTTIKE